MRRLMALVASTLVLSGCAIRKAELPPLKVGILEETVPLRFDRDRLKSLPSFNYASMEPFQVDLRSQDISGLDLSDRFHDLTHADFDSLTKWPESLPKAFDTHLVMELGKNPGLGVRGLHERGVTGEGVSIGIVDQPLLPDHVEYKDRLKHYEVIKERADTSAMHGPAVASIAGGKTVGVAPGADLYYIAASGNAGHTPTWTYRAQAIERFLDINETLPSEKRIRVISISWGAGRTTDGYQYLVDAINRAKKAGVFVITVSLGSFYGMQFHGLGRNPFLDPDDPNSYSIALFLRAAGYEPGSMTEDQEAWLQAFLVLPMDSRCTASPTGPNDYAFYPSGGMSWGAPYLAGLYALACQVKPSVTPDEFWETAWDTATLATFGRIVNPVKLMEVLEQLQGNP